MGPFQKSSEIKNNEMKRQDKPYNKLEELKETKINIIPQEALHPFHLSDTVWNFTLKLDSLVEQIKTKETKEETLLLLREKLLAKMVLKIEHLKSRTI